MKAEPRERARDAERWGTVAQLLHWSVAVLVLAQLPLGWSAATWPLSPLKLDLFAWHKSIGMLVLALMAVRGAWRLTHGSPALPQGVPEWARRSAHAVHLLLYTVLIAMPVSGWVLNSAANVPFRIFRLIPLPAIVEPGKAVAELAARAHLALFVVLAVLLALHVGAVAWHHWIRRDGILERMLPGRIG
jgi:cytochrome b561